MRLAVRHFVLGLLISMFWAGAASAQYMRITTDNPADNTRMRASGTTILTITLDTNHDKGPNADGSGGALQTCNSHTTANGCGAATTTQNLDMFSYTLALKAVGGTVSWGTFTVADANYTDTSPQISSDTEVEINKARPTGTVSAPGLNTLGTLAVTTLTGAPGIQVQHGASILNPFGFGTGFGTNCDGFFFGNTYVIGDPADPCGLTSGVAGDWFDFSGALSASGNTPPNLSAPPTATGVEGTALTPIVATATDVDNPAQTLTMTLSGTPPSFISFSSTAGNSPVTGTVTGTPGFDDAGSYGINWHVTDGTDVANATTALTITNNNRAPTLAQPANMTVNEGATAEQVISGSDPDNDALTFGIVSGPGFMSLAAGADANHPIVRLVPSFTQSGTYNASVQVTDGTAPPDVKNFTITVTNTNRAPVLAQPNDMTVTAGATADQSITATDADSDPLTFSKTTGPAFVTVTTTNTTTGNIHLAPAGGDVGTHSVTVQASDGTANNAKSLTVTVEGGTNNPPVLAQPANMTVAENATADQALSATDADGQALTFSKASGPTYATVTTTTPGTGTGTGNIHLAPGFSDSGTASASVSVTDGSASDSKSLTITVTNVNRAPTLNAIANMTVAQGATADQSITGSDPDGDPLTFTQISGPTFMTVTTTNATTGNIHLAAGALEPTGVTAASVRAADGALFSNVQPFTVTVTATNQAPTLAQPNNMTVAEGATADQALNATDPNGDALTFTLVSGPTYATVSTTTPGTGTGTGNIHLAPGFSDAGTASATVQASDGSLNNQKSLTITVTNTNRAPTLDPISPMTVTEGSTADQTITGSDPDGDALTFSKVTGPTFLTITTSTPTSGNVHVAPVVGDAGASPYTVQAQASDGTLNDTHIFQVTVNPFVAGNNAPTLTQPADMTVAEGATADQTITATDQDGNALSFAKVTGPAFMTVTTSTPGTGTGTGNIHLAPGFTDAGTYSASVAASDGSLSDSKSLTITVTNTNQAPTLQAIADMTVTENATADQVISATDPDTDPLTFTKVTGPAFMTVSTTNTVTGNVHLAPGAGTAGTYNASASASDGTLSDTKSFLITVNPFVAGNNAPTLTQPADMTVAEGATADQAITGTDQDGDALTFTKVSGPAFLTVTTTTPGTGTGTGNINLAPGFSDSGTYSATVRVSDGSLSDDKSLTVTVTNTNRVPDLGPITNMTVTEGATADQSILGSDPDGDALTFTKASGPAFMTVSTTNPTVGNIHLAPGAGTAGTYNASATASDGSLSDTESFVITVNAGQQNHAPVLDQPTDMTVAEGATADQQLTATDQDGDGLTFSKVVGPTFETVSPQGNVHLAPGFADAGTYSSTVRVSDGSLSDDKSFTITVTNVNRAPVADAGGPYTGSIGIPLSFSGTGSSDPDGDALTYSWDFDATDGIQEDATGATPSHTYSSAGAFTVTLTVSDGTLTDDDTATATISETNVLQALIFVDGGDKIIRLNNQRPFWCVHIRPVDGNFRLSDIIPTTVRLNFNGQSIPAIGRRLVEDEDEDGGRSLFICFGKEALRTLFASLGNGRRQVTVTVTGDLQGGTSFTGTLSVPVQKGGGPGALAKDGNGHDDAFAWASPNPLNPVTTITFALTQPGSVRLAVYDVSGRLVNTLANGIMGAGIHDVRWDGTSRAGTKVASGVYFYVLSTSERTVKGQLVVAK